ncbi:MAG: DEAD/DEAH box helicase [Verrucomicrobia bacterium]|nr:DEAD/DEAH box helicase [Verrucomicrobiota bacterium]
MTFTNFFQAAAEHLPYDYQIRLAGGDSGTECRSQLINVPTGLGKTAAVVLAWLWNRVGSPTLGSRRTSFNQNWPRRLVYCLPMRTLVEQTRVNAALWLKNLSVRAAELAITGSALQELEWLREHSPIILMGGEEADGDWDVWPEKPAILIGTQDMLLSRALNRGYGMSRYRWPIHFGLLNNDCLWVMDETQLMGPGLWTSGQLDWMRQHRFGVLKPCFTWWMSATPSPVFLDTPDRRKDDATMMPVVEVGDDPAALSRLNPTRPLSFWKDTALKAKAKKKGAPPATFSDSLATAIRAEHRDGTLSLVVCNSVKAAQELYRTLGRENAILLTSRFRRGDRDEHTKRLLAFEDQRKAVAKQNPEDNTVPDSPGLICISTQVVEAGVDISARTLWMEAAPWPSALQRLGRLNRDGRADGKARAFVFEWPQVGKQSKGQSIGPYEAKDIEDSKKLLTNLAAIYEEEPKLGAKDAMDKLRASSGAEMEAALKPKDEEFPRAMDVHGLFSTEPDVFGGFTDVSPWVRGADKNADVTVFWREFEAKKGPGKTKALTGPAFDASEGCAVAIHRVRDFLDKGRVHVWDERNEQWQSLRPDDIRPGMVVMLPRTEGGYSTSLGWTGQSGDRLDEAPPPGRFSDTFEEDATTEHEAGWVRLDKHLADVKAAATRITDALHLDASVRTAVISAAEWHDIGKAHNVWQKALPRSEAEMKAVWAKAPFVFALEGKNSAAFRNSTERLIGSAGFTAKFLREEPGRDKVPRQLWTVSAKICDTRSRQLLSEIEDQAKGQLEGWMRRFQPRLGKTYIRHEAASTLAAWSHYFKDTAAWPGLTLFLIACHHGKVRTVLYARGDDGEDVCGVPRQPDSLPWASGLPMEFSCAAVGTGGEFSEDGLTFIPASPGWTGLVSDILGGWEKRPREASPPLTLRDAAEPRLLGPFKLAYLESLICAADIHASQEPSDLRHV